MLQFFIIQISIFFFVAKLKVWSWDILQPSKMLSPEKNMAFGIYMSSILNATTSQFHDNCSGKTVTFTGSDINKKIRAYQDALFDNFFGYNSCSNYTITNSSSLYDKSINKKTICLTTCFINPNITRYPLKFSNEKFSYSRIDCLAGILQNYYCTLHLDTSKAHHIAPTRVVQFSTFKVVCELIDCCLLLALNNDIMIFLQARIIIFQM